jgi:hypothetical protein
MSTPPELLTENEIHELSAKLKASLNPLTFDKPFVEYKRQSNRATQWTLSGVAAAFIAVIAYSVIGQLGVAPAWSASPLKVSAANEAEILSTCSLLLPKALRSGQVPSSEDPKVHLVDFRSDYGDAVLITGGMNPQTTRTWTCHFIKPKNSKFNAIDLSEAKFSYNYVAGNPKVINTSQGISAAAAIPTAPIASGANIARRESVSVVWRGGDSFNGVKIPASQIMSGPVIFGAVSVKVKCPNLPSAEAAISNNGGIFSIWIPSTSPKCVVTYIDRNGKIRGTSDNGTGPISAPWSSPLPSGAATMSRADAEQLARTAIHAANIAPTFSAMLSGSKAIQKFGIVRSSNTDESRPVWIVTVVSPVNTDGGPGVAPQTKKYYSAIVDAGSKQITDDCIGCDWLTVSK